MKREKFNQSRTFGQNFVNVARMISHKTEMNKKGFVTKSSLFKTQTSNICFQNTSNSVSFSYSNSKSNSVLSNSISCGNQKQRMIQRNVVSSLRETNKENRNTLKEFNTELEQQKRKLEEKNIKEKLEKKENKIKKEIDDEKQKRDNKETEIKTKITDIQKQMKEEQKVK